MLVCSQKCQFVSWRGLQLAINRFKYSLVFRYFWSDCMMVQFWNTLLPAGFKPFRSVSLDCPTLMQWRLHSTWHRHMDKIGWMDKLWSWLRFSVESAFWAPIWLQWVCLQKGEVELLGRPWELWLQGLLASKTLPMSGSTFVFSWLTSICACLTSNPSHVCF